MTFFTDLPTAKHFEWVIFMIDRKVQKILRYLSFYDHLLLVLMKPKLELYNKDLMFRFKIKPVAVSRIFVLGGRRVVTNSCRAFAVFNIAARKRSTQKAIND